MAHKIKWLASCARIANKDRHRSIYYKPTKAPPKLDDRFVTPIKALIEEEPSFGYRTVAWLLGFNSEAPNATGLSERAEHCAARLSDKGLAGAQTIYWRSAAR